MVSRIETGHLEALLTFLTVARLGRFTAAAETLGVNHSTVSRRLADLEKSLGEKLLTRGHNGWELTEFGARAMVAAETAEKSLQELHSLNSDKDSTQLTGVVRVAAPDAFTTNVAVPAFAKLQRAEPGLGIEIMTATQQVRQRRSGVDIEVVIGHPKVNKALTRRLMSYNLCLYATNEYLNWMGTPTTLEDLATHRLNYYIESALQVDDLDLGARRIPAFKDGISSTSVFAHMASTLSGAGIGLLPDYLGNDPRLVRLLPSQFIHKVTYWAVVREENNRNPAVRACLKMLELEAAELEKSTMEQHKARGTDVI